MPVNDGAGNSLNGCLPDDPLDISANDWIGQVVPARMGETLIGHFYDRHRPTEPLTFEVRAFADTCDNGHTEAYLGTVTVSPPNFEFSFPIPTINRICAPTSPGTPANEPIDGILLRPLVASDRQVPLAVVMPYFGLPEDEVIRRTEKAREDYKNTDRPLDERARLANELRRLGHGRRDLTRRSGRAE